MEYEGIDLMSFRKQAGINKEQILDVLYQSAIAVETTNFLGIFCDDIQPDKFVYKNGHLKLLGCQLFSQMDSKNLLNLFLSHKTSKNEGYSSFCPPEIVDHKPTEEKVTITAEKVTAYRWGMTMLQFVTNMTDEELKYFADSMKKDNEVCFSMTEKIKKMTTHEFDSTTNSCVMNIISKCLEYTPSTRLNMKQVLKYLNNPYGEFSEIFNSFSEEKKVIYSKQIPELIDPKTFEFQEEEMKEKIVDPWLPTESNYLNLIQQVESIVQFI